MSKATAAAQHAQYERDKDSGAYSGSRKQLTWNEVAKQHDCCGSKKAIYHKAGCKYRTERAPRTDDEKPASDDLRTLVHALKADGMNSEQVLEELRAQGHDRKLSEVNRVWN